MAASTGRSFLLKTGAGTSVVTVAGLRTTGFSVAGEAVDVTNKDSANNLRELLAGAGVSSLSVSGAGVMQNGTQEIAFINAVKDRTLATYSLVFGTGQTISGAFQVTSFEGAGEHNGEATYNVGLESAGTWSVA